MRGTAIKSTLFAGFTFVLVTGIAMAQSSASKDYLQDCAECHGADGKGAQPEKRTARGYVSVDLTRISKNNGGEFPRVQVYDAINGRNRIAAHFLGDMPRWGTRYSIDERDGPAAEQRVRDRISALVDFVESMQEK
jgi:hypothetical protein